MKNGEDNEDFSNFLTIFAKIIVLKGAEFKGSCLLKGWRYEDCTHFLEKFSLLNSRMELGFFGQKRAFLTQYFEIFDKIHCIFC